MAKGIWQRAMEELAGERGVELDEVACQMSDAGYEADRARSQYAQAAEDLARDLTRAARDARRGHLPGNVMSSSLVADVARYGGEVEARERAAVVLVRAVMGGEAARRLKAMVEEGFLAVEMGVAS